MRRAIVTVCSRNYLHHTLALAESVRACCPDTDFHLCLADEPLKPCKHELAKCHTFLASQLRIPNWHRFAFQYTPFELCCALKPYAMQHVLDQGYEQVIYLDTDMRVLDDFHEVATQLESNSIVLTPHLIKPFPRDGRRPDENLFLMAGTFNAGFLAIRNDANARSFLDWWSQRLEFDGHQDMAASMFVDQKWLSLVPGLFPNVGILRNPAYNTGHWTLPQFSLELNAHGEPCIDGHPVVLFHFSNLKLGELGEFSHCQTRFSLSDLPALQKLVADYHLAVRRNDTQDFTSWECEHDRLSDGTWIHPAWREAIRRQHETFADIANPFDIAANPNLKEQFAALQGAARKWRVDWRLKGIKPTEPKRKNRVDRRFKAWLGGLGWMRSKAA